MVLVRFQWRSLKKNLMMPRKKKMIVLVDLEFVLHLVLLEVWWAFVVVAQMTNLGFFLAVFLLQEVRQLACELLYVLQLQ